MKVAIYARVSTGDQSVDSQLHDLGKYCVFRKWDCVEKYLDVISGATRRRHELDRLMRDARVGKIHTVLVWKFDRFARGALQLIEALETFRELDIDFVSLRDGVDTTTPTGKAMFVMVAAFAELERETIRERVRSGLSNAQEKLKAGPYQVKRDGKMHTVTHLGRPKIEREWISAVDLITMGGKSLREVARELKCSPATVLNRLRELRKESKHANG